MKKKLIALITALTLCAVVVVGGTLAYFSFTTDEVKNVFTYDKDGGDGGGEIEEPGWEDPDGKTFTPNMELRKDPRIRITGGNDTYWVGMTITGTSTMADYDSLGALMAESTLPGTVGGPLKSINGMDTTGNQFKYWKGSDGTIYAVYQLKLYGPQHDDYVLDTNDVSSFAFTSVTIQSQEVLDALIEKNLGAFPDFDIVVQGYLVSTLNDTVLNSSGGYDEFALPEDALGHAFGDVFDFDNLTSYTPA